MEEVLQSPFFQETQYLHNVSAAPNFYQSIPRGGIATGTPGLSSYQQIQPPSQVPDFSSRQTVQPSLGYPRTRDYFSQAPQIPNGHLENSVPSYFSPYMSDGGSYFSPYMSDGGGSWSTLSRSRNSFLSQFT